jgi:hypothetical protein
MEPPFICPVKDCVSQEFIEGEPMNKDISRKVTEMMGGKWYECTCPALVSRPIRVHSLDCETQINFKPERWDDFGKLLTFCQLPENKEKWAKFIREYGFDNSHLIDKKLSIPEHHMQFLEIKYLNPLPFATAFTESWGK